MNLHTSDSPALAPTSKVMNITAVIMKDGQRVFAHAGRNPVVGRPADELGYLPFAQLTTHQFYPEAHSGGIC